MAFINWATHVLQWLCQRVAKALSRSESQKNNLSSDCRLQFACMKSESLVIVDQHATVNILGPCTHRPSRQGSEIGSKWKSFKENKIVSYFQLENIYYLFFLEDGMTDGFMTVMKS